MQLFTHFFGISRKEALTLLLASMWLGFVLGAGAVIPIPPPKNAPLLTAVPTDSQNQRTTERALAITRSVLEVVEQKIDSLTTQNPTLRSDQDFLRSLQEIQSIQGAYLQALSEYEGRLYPISLQHTSRSLEKLDSLFNTLNSFDPTTPARL